MVAWGKLETDSIERQHPAMDEAGTQGDTWLPSGIHSQSQRRESACETGFGGEPS